MSTSFIARVKKTLLDGASTTASKVEEATRVGKIKLDLIAEENRLENRFARLGRKAWEAMQADKLGDLSEDTTIQEISESISATQQRIEDLKTRLASIHDEKGT